MLLQSSRLKRSSAMSDMNMRVSVAESKSKVLDWKPDLEWIEEFIYRAYTN